MIGGGGQPGWFIGGTGNKQKGRIRIKKTGVLCTGSLKTPLFLTSKFKETVRLLRSARIPIMPLSSIVRVSG